ncbi:Suppressor of fused protein (SUFU) [Deinococcus reticulitermitis]|uniref:Suppressor of fused protein (SUFU) n=1 Tax=Deinococcus reticulitermitis TaxID=856736 RepID=A0A1H6U9F8_9DEIO|nr:suppressor of fused domain protein [Deinococcus reticulitermitis]SEI89013.1 Suppressor of fused protein (SUFU) [Deinococcus reticulitermitis]
MTRADESDRPEWRARERMERHLSRFLGEATVWHEIVPEAGSGAWPVDIYRFAPTPGRPFHTLVTSGLSTRPMTVPEGVEEWSRAELVLCLPADWPLTLGEGGDLGDLADPEHAWPLELLRTLARLPHEHGTWLGWGHTVPNGHPPQPLAGTGFTGSLIGPVVTLPDEFLNVELEGEALWFYGVFPLYPEEIEFKLGAGAQALFDRLEAFRVTELVALDRPNVVTSRLPERA